MGIFITPYDIANRACQHLGVPRIASFSDTSKQAVEFGFNYDKLRRSELMKNVWGCATKRAILRKIVIGTTKSLTFASWAVGTTYGRGDIVKDSSSTLWISNVASNVGNTPGVGGIDPSWSVYYGNVIAHAWDTAVAYKPGDMVFVSTTAYICFTAHSANTPPNATYWLPTTATVGGVITFFSPIGYPKDGGTIRNIYRRPANFLRIAPLDPKVAGNVRSNTTAGMQYNDFEFEGDYIMSSYWGSTAQADPLVLRFVADQTDVPSMDDTLCEALAARMAVECAETITQSKQKKMDAVALYDNAIQVARMVNAIEAGTTEPEPNSSIPGASIGGQGQERG